MDQRTNQNGRPHRTAVLERAGINTAATVAAAAFTGWDGAGPGSAFAARPGGTRKTTGSSFVTPPASPGIVYHGAGKFGTGGAKKRTSTTIKKKRLGGGGGAYGHSSSSLLGANLVGVGASGWQRQQHARRNGGADVDPSPPPWKSSFTPPTKLDGRAAWDPSHFGATVEGRAVARVLYYCPTPPHTARS